MPDVTLRHEIDCDEDTFWSKCFLNEEFTTKLYLEELKFPAFKLAEQKDDAGAITRKAIVDPPLVGLPGPMKKALGDSFSYTESGRFDKGTKRYTFTIVPSALGDKAKTTGEIYCEKLGDKKIARIAKMHVEVKVFMIGSMIEEKIVADMKSSYEKAAAFTNRWVREKGY